MGFVAHDLLRLWGLMNQAEPIMAQLADLVKMGLKERIRKNPEQQQLM